MLVQEISIPGHGDSDSSKISTSTRLPDAALQDHAMDLAFQRYRVCKFVRYLDVSVVDFLYTGIRELVNDINIAIFLD